MPIPLLLIHGYSDVGESFKKWKQILVEKGIYTEDQIHICNYRTLTNEVTIKDIAEGFDRALRINSKIKPDEPFDAVVHSTGMLVLRSWLSSYSRYQRLKHLIALAPASFGSPLAHKGRSWIGSIFKGNKEKGPDFMEAGNLVLDGLELGSKFTWDLAHKDLLSKEVFYGPGDDTPYLFTFCGDTAYKGLKGLVTASPGTDGTVRWAGCSLNTRKIMLDFTRSPEENRHEMTDWPNDKRSNLATALIPIRDLNHGTIIEDPSEELVNLVIDALKVDSDIAYQKWMSDAMAATEPTYRQMQKWQQFVVHARDERGDPITDYNLQLYRVPKGKNADNEDHWEPVKIDVHAYGADNSYRCFHVNLEDLTDDRLQNLRLEFMASTGTELLGYLEYVPEGEDADLSIYAQGQPTFTMDLTPLVNDSTVKFFYPFTTTLIEIVLNREPLPVKKINKVTQFLE